MNTARVSKITVGRLYNLGSYEHLRCEVTVEIPEHVSASSVFIGLERLFVALDPKCPAWITGEDEIEREKRRLADMREMTDDAFDRQFGGYKGTRHEYTARIEAGIRESEQKLADWKRRQLLARMMFDSLGGSSVFKDAKLDWEERL